MSKDKQILSKPCCSQIHLHRRRRTFWEKCKGIKEVYCCANCHRETSLK